MSVYAGPEIVNDGLVLHLDAGNIKSYSGSGTTWYDISGNARNSTLTNGPVFNSTYFSFDGINDVATLSNNFIAADSPLSVSVWVKARSDGMLVDTINDSTSWDGFTIKIQSGFYGWWLFKQYSGPNIQKVLTSTSVYNGNWQNIVGTYDGTTSSLYINGVLNVSASYSAGYDVGVANIGIGARASTGTPANCDISNVSIYNRALSASEVLQNFNALRGRFNI